jgi:hypothetical protein
MYKYRLYANKGNFWKFAIKNFVFFDKQQFYLTSNQYQIYEKKIS